MWAVPVVAAAVAMPLAAASTQSQVNLWSTARLPDSPPDGFITESGNTLPYYQGPRTLAFTYTFGNLGPDPLPSGAVVSLALPLDLIWNTATLAITNSGGYPLAPAGTRTETIATNPLALRRIWDFVLNLELAAGASFAVNFTVDLNDSSDDATDFYRVLMMSDFQLQPGADVTDTDSTNNPNANTEYVIFNPPGV